MNEEFSDDDIENQIGRANQRQPPPEFAENSLDELDHRESDEGINDDNPDFNGNEFMFKKRQLDNNNNGGISKPGKKGKTLNFSPAGI